jgi:hypothetical protein
MKGLVAVLVLVGAPVFADSDNFNAPLLDPNKWGYTGSPFSDAFVKGVNNISFQSNTDTEAGYGFIYWKQKMNLSESWSASIKVEIDLNFVTGDLAGDYGNVQASLGVVDSITQINKTYFNTLLRENWPNNPFANQFYFNPNYEIGTGFETEVRTPIGNSNKTLLEINHHASLSKITSKMYAENNGEFNLLVGSHEFDTTEWGELAEVYVVVGGMSVNTITPAGTASLDDFSIVPEPSTLSLLLASGAVLMAGRRREQD